MNVELSRYMGLVKTGLDPKSWRIVLKAVDVPEIVTKEDLVTLPVGIQDLIKSGERNATPKKLASSG
jgi:hypothetical protein